ncbi:cytochrome c oxidase assembly protein [Marinactinospora endophytica]
MHHPPTGPGWADVVITLLLAVALAGYTVGLLRLWRRGVSWPVGRFLSWVMGVAAVGAALVGPVAEAAHHDFAAHMAAHVLLGMLGPLLLVLAAPATLALRVLPTRAARPLGRLLGSAPVGVLAHPVTAAVLNVGGLWLLYRSDLYALTLVHPGAHLLVHFHVLAAGYLFSYAIVGPDPAPHRPGPPTRAGVLVLAVAAHNVLAKTVYAFPPTGVPVDQAREGGLVMYYAGAPVEIALIVVLCHRWLGPAARSRAAGRVMARG